MTEIVVADVENSQPPEWQPTAMPNTRANLGIRVRGWPFYFILFYFILIHFILFQLILFSIRLCSK